MGNQLKLATDIYNQLKLATDIYNLLISLGYECELVHSGCRIDILVEIGTVSKTDLTVGIVAVFWNSKGENHEIGYLCAGEPHSDGYEIHRDWINVNSINDINSILEKDILDLKAYHVK